MTTSNRSKIGYKSFSGHMSESRHIHHSNVSSVSSRPLLTDETRNYKDTRDFTNNIKCPDCNSDRVWLYGYSPNAKQRYVCRDCGRTFINRKGINTLSDNRTNYQICDTDGVSKNLGINSMQIEKILRANQQTNTFKQTLIDFSLWLYRDGKAESTIIRYVTEMQLLAKRGANILNEESVKETIANQETWSNNRKFMEINVYTTFLRFLGRTWIKPKYQKTRTIPFIPTEKTLSQIIAGIGKKTSTYCQLLKETGIRPCQADKLEWLDIDYERRIIRIKPAKNGNPLLKKVTKHLIARIKALPEQSKYVFNLTGRASKQTSYLAQRKRLALKTGNKDILRVTFYTFRYWYGTTLYHKTKDLLKVKEALGHKKIENTLFYVQIAEALFDDKPDNYHVATATTPEEFDKLLTNSWEYVTKMEFNGTTLHKFRKPKEI